jgi:hypothetical protein
LGLRYTAILKERDVAATASMKERDIALRYVELAVGILSAEPKPKTDAIRRWAISIMERQSPVPLSDDVEDQLLKEKLSLEFQSNLIKSMWDQSMNTIRNVR